MLYQIGATQFTATGFNTNETSRSAETSFAVKEVLGGPPSREYVGEGEERVTLKGTMFPKRVAGFGDMAALQAARVAGMPQLVMRGDGHVLGWFVIEAINEESTYLAADGVGQCIEFDVTLARVGRPVGMGSIAAIVEALF